jgi:hypothetical protein
VTYTKEEVLELLSQGEHRTQEEMLEIVNALDNLPKEDKEEIHQFLVDKYEIPDTEHQLMESLTNAWIKTSQMLNENLVLIQGLDEETARLFLDFVWLRNYQDGMEQLIEEGGPRAVFTAGFALGMNTGMFYTVDNFDL